MTVCWGYTINKTGSSYFVKMNRDDTLFASTYSIISDSTQSYTDLVHRVGFQNPDTAREIVFLGCSVTFGVGLDDSASLAYKTGITTKLNTYNLGVEGYGTHQAYQLFLNKYAGVSNVNRVFVYSFIYDHILRANGIHIWSLSGPFFKVNDDSLVYAGPVHMNVEKHDRKYILYLSGLGTFGFLRQMLSNIATRSRINKLKHEDFDRCFLMIKTMAGIIEKTGGQFVLIDWGDSHWNDHLINDELIAAFKKKLEALTNLRIIQVSAVMDLNDARHFIPDDGHPSALANEKLAAELSSIKLWPSE
ncbi:hypothetical protein [Pseudobacter ginsenosidimutans]|uniref:GDSL-like lipase/acylhydrolase family protein n=1 Tax=Pseudobacter ginsenosidimutans TaxID=661488 RepID=A0A4Q7MTC7_9BACT|nr:hypothetical protein [Pseudobacter ginsenosidimutans]QEC41979.1 hypothetical protein FSB84_09870 [Pseudobacter ginsenosidimutans]RZS71194.1 hypothetical protein EV199_3095 [Pseudobacter ginsenosidimutans]